jgi:hypothetical protein
LPQKNAKQNAPLRQYTPQARSPFWLLQWASEHGHARLLLRPSWSWAVLLPNDNIENLLRPLQLFYFHLWLIYWLSYFNALASGKYSYRCAIKV